MRLTGILSIGLILMSDYFIVSSFMGFHRALIIVLFVFLFGVIGEFCELSKAKAVRLDKYRGYEREKLARCLEGIDLEMRNKFNKPLKPGLRVYIIGNNRLVACSFGNSVCVSRSSITDLDDGILTALVAREIGHAYRLDAVFHRIVMENVFVAGLLVLASTQILSVAICLIILFLCIVRIFRRRFFSFFLFRGIRKGVVSLVQNIQRLFLTGMRALISSVRRHSEYSCDKFCASIGYAAQLIMYLERYVEDNTPSCRMADILYHSFPNTGRRIMLLQHSMSTQLQ